MVFLKKLDKSSSFKRSIRLFLVLDQEKYQEKAVFVKKLAQNNATQIEISVGRYVQLPYST